MNTFKVNIFQGKGYILINKIVIILLFPVILLAENETSNELVKQRIEVTELKKELNSFYNKKEKEYQDRKKELETILSQIEKEKEEIQALYDKNLSILQDMTQTIDSKTSKVYNSMKPKISAAIFNEMINNGKIEDVFDIILKLKEKNVTLLMKYLSVQNAAKLTLMLQNFKAQN